MKADVRHAMHHIKGVYPEIPDQEPQMSLKPVCVPCERFMRMKRAAFYFIEGMPTRPQPEIGKGALD